MNPPSNNTMTTQVKALLRRNEENMQKVMETTLGKMQDKLKKDMESLKQQHQIEIKHLAQEHQVKMQALQEQLATRSSDHQAT